MSGKELPEAHARGLRGRRQEAGEELRWPGTQARLLAEGCAPLSGLPVTRGVPLPLDPTEAFRVLERHSCTRRGCRVTPRAGSRVGMPPGQGDQGHAPREGRVRSPRTAPLPWVPRPSPRARPTARPAAGGEPRTTAMPPTAGLGIPRRPPTSGSHLTVANTWHPEPILGRLFRGLGPAAVPPLVGSGGGGTRRLRAELREATSARGARRRLRVRGSRSPAGELALRL